MPTNDGITHIQAPVSANRSWRALTFVLFEEGTHEVWTTLISVSDLLFPFFKKQKRRNAVLRLPDNVERVCPHQCYSQKSREVISRTHTSLSTTCRIPMEGEACSKSVVVTRSHMVEAVQSGCSQMMKLKVRDTATHSRTEKKRVYSFTNLPISAATCPLKP